MSISKKKTKKQENKNNRIEWLRNPILSLCFFVGNKKITGRFKNIREIPINEEFKDTLYRFMPKGSNYKLSVEKSYQLLLKEPSLISKYKKILEKRSNKKKKGESLDILIESFQPNQEHIFIEVKRYMGASSRIAIESDIEKVKSLIQLYNSKEKSEKSPKAKGFVLVISQERLPSFIVDHEKLSAIREPILSNKNKKTKYKNRITCIVLSRNLNKINLDTENKQLKGIFACLLEVVT